MFNFRKQIIVLYVSIFLITLGGSASANSLLSGGDYVGSGGDFLPLQFKRYAYLLLDSFHKNAFSEIPELDALSPEEVRAAIQNTEVEVVEGPIYDSKGKSVGARYIEEFAKIQIVRTVWLRNLVDEDNVWKLVLHEYLRVLKVNDDGYRLTSQVDNIGVSRNQGLYSDLLTAFSRAKMVEFKDVEGVYSGRCLTPKRSQSLGGSGLIIGNYPNWKGQATSMIIEGEADITGLSDPSFFDQLPIKIVLDYFLPISGEFSTPEYNGEQLQVTHYWTNSLILIRKSGNTLMLAYKSLVENEIDFYGDFSIKLAKNELYTLCYYLKKVNNEIDYQDLH